MLIDFTEDDTNRNLRMEQISDAMDSDFDIVIDDEDDFCIPNWDVLMPKVGEEIEEWEENL